jgi:hypothetical protein
MRFIGTEKSSIMVSSISRAKVFRFIFYLLLMLAVPLLARADQSPSNAIDRVVSAVNAASLSAQKATIAGELGLNALRNVMAVSNLEQEHLLLALKSRDAARIKAARETWTRAVADVDAALDSTQQIVKYADRSASAHMAARDEATRAAKAATVGESESAARKAERQADDAQKAAKTAESMAEILKKKWLVPSPIATPSPAEAAAIQPSADAQTPAEKRQ